MFILRIYKDEPNRQDWPTGKTWKHEDYDLLNIPENKLTFK